MINPKIEKRINKTEKLIPETNISDSQTEEINIVWPISGWEINNKSRGDTMIALKKYLKYKFFLLSVNTIDKSITKKDFTSSIGWNLGKKAISIHLFEPFTSIPIIGTKINAKKVKKNKIIENFH